MITHCLVSVVSSSIRRFPSIVLPESRDALNPLHSTHRIKFYGGYYCPAVLHRPSRSNSYAAQEAGCGICIGPRKAHEFGVLYGLGINRESVTTHQMSTFNHTL